jgi:catechol 2,3-dioxygenase-like lactoylglutathione lyase family enzyme
MGYINSIAHINITVPDGTLHLADEFYRDTLGLTKVPVPKAQQDILAWSVFRLGQKQPFILKTCD